LIKGVIFDFFLTLVYLKSKYEEERARVIYDYLINRKMVSLNFEKFFNIMKDCYTKWRRIKYENLIEVSQYMWIADLLVNFLQLQIKMNDIMEIIKRRNMIIVNNAEIYPDVISTLEKLKEMKLLLILITNTDDSDLAFKLLDKFHIKSYFDFIVTSEYVNMRKPDPNIVKYALKHVDLAPENTIIVGDSMKDDILCGYLANIRTVYIDRPYKEENPYLNAPLYKKIEIENIKPDFRIQSLEDLIGIIKKINNKKV